MENASKALIIAGAILLAIAIIGVAMLVFRGASETAEGAADMTPQQIEIYNQTFLNYEGEKNGSQVKSLCEAVRSHNVTPTDPSKKVSLIEGIAQDISAPTTTGTKGTTSGEIDTIKSKILSGRQYTVSLGFDPDTGRVTQIGIQAN